ncbi:MAG: SemiSWEET transporter [Desulfuromonadaceae bacterium]|nr:SemiSWEET transporter [Desulfuromonadaceae bacterium]MDD5104853.1 SemiSWEET transporter [Desulfuromonadaceae bacterium]
MNPTTIGFVAGALTSVAAIPQVVKTMRSRQAHDISIWQPLLLAFGVALWMVYGILIGDTPLILANITPLVCNVVLTVLKIRYDKTDRCG